MMDSLTLESLIENAHFLVNKVNTLAPTNFGGKEELSILPLNFSMMVELSM